MDDHSAAPRIGTKDEFRDWLGERLNKRVGYVARTASCPVANWLRSLNPGRKLHVCFAGGTVKVADIDDPIQDRVFPLPTWAVDFADALDMVIPWIRGERDVDGSQALAVLKDTEE